MTTANQTDRIGGKRDYLDPTKATKLRIFTEDTLGDNGEDTVQWSIDAIDEAGNYTEACWSFDTFAQAYHAAADFTRAHVPHLAPCGYLTKGGKR